MVQEEIDAVADNVVPSRPIPEPVELSPVPAPKPKAGKGKKVAQAELELIEPAESERRDYGL
jgi:hypothetical protein